MREELAELKKQYQFNIQAAENPDISPDDRTRLLAQAEEVKARAKSIYNAGRVPTSGEKVRQLAQGATLGFADEIEAAARAPFSDQSYTDIRNQIRTEQDLFQQDFPSDALALEMTGGALVPGIGLANVARAPTVGGQVMRMSGLGALGGGTAGLGYSESETVPGMALDTAIGSGLGATLGGGLTAIPALWGVGNQAIRQVLKSDPDRAREVIGRLARETGWTERQIADEIEGLGPEATLADLDDNFMGMLLGARQKSPEAIGMIEDVYGTRQAGARDRIIGSLEEASGFDVGDYRQTRGALEEARSEAADVMYDVPRGQMVPSSGMKGLTAHQRVRPVIYDAGKDLNLSKEEIDVMLEDGMMPFELVNLVKQKLDTKGAQAATTVLGSGRRSADEAMYSDLAREWRTAADEYLPGYKEARGTYSAYSDLLGAGEQGRRITRIRDAALEDLPDDLSRLSESEREMFKMGALDNIAEDVNAGGTKGTGFPASRIYNPNDPQKQARLDIIDTDRILDEALGREARFHTTFSMTNPTTGSRTAVMDAAEEQMDDAAGLLGEAVRASQGDMIGLVRVLESNGMSRGVATEIAQRLTNKNLTSTELSRIMKTGELPPALVEELSPIWNVSQGALLPATGGALQ